MSYYLINPSGVTVELDDERLYKNLLNSRGFSKATSAQKNAFLLTKNPSLFDNNLQLVAPAQSHDGYGTLVDNFKRGMADLNVCLDKNYSGQRAGVAFGYPESLRGLKTEIKILITMFESTKIPTEWIDDLKKADLVIVPSKFCQEAFEKSGIKTEVIPLGYDDSIFTYKPKTKKEKFTFLHYNAFNHRKGWDLVFKAFNREFDNDEPVELILKTTLKHIPIPIIKSEYPNITTINRPLPHYGIAKLLHEADAFVLPSRGEGFGIPPLESLATGTPTLIPNAHGFSQYFDSNYFFELDVYKQEPAIYDRFRGQNMGKMYSTSIKSIKKQMRFVYENQKYALKKAKEGADWVKRNYTYKKTAELFYKKLEKLGVVKSAKQPVKTAKKADVNVVGMFQGCGYSFDAENIALALDEMGLEVKIIPHPERGVSTADFQERTQQLFARNIAKADQTIVSLPIAFFKDEFRIGKTYIRTMLETDIIPSYDIGLMNSLDGFLATCDQAMKDYKSSGLNVPTYLLEMTIDFDKWNQPLRPRRNFTFLTYGDQSLRKGTDILATAFKLAFPDDNGVELIIKTGKTMPHIINDSRIKIVRDRLTRKGLVDLVSSAHCVVFPSRGEGWGLGATESMALGLPVILADWAGLSQQANSKYNYPLEIKKMTSARNYFLPKSSRMWDIGDWAEPDAWELAKLMKHVKDNYTEAQQKGQKAKEWVRDRFSRENQIKQLANVFDNTIKIENPKQ